MFDKSNIGHSGLTSQKPKINYNSQSLEKEGYKLKYALNPKNPIYTQVISELKKQSIPYKKMLADNDQEHIWIKDN